MDQATSNPSSATLDSRFSSSKPVLDDDAILDRGVSPRFQTQDFTATHWVEEVGHPCGDLVRLFALIDHGVISDISHRSRACCMTKALTDILCEHLKGRTVEALMLIQPADIVRVAVSKNREGCIRLPFDLLKRLYSTHAATIGLKDYEVIASQQVLSEQAQAVRPEGSRGGDPRGAD